MTTPQTIRQSVGLRHVQILAVAADGYPAASSTAAYEGVTITGAKALTLNDPEPRQIIHEGDDNILQLDVLPATEPISGELRVGKTNDVVDAVLTDDASITVGQAQLFGVGTDNKGDENQVFVLAYRQSLEADPDGGTYGARRYDFRLMKAFLIPRDGNMDGNAEERIYTLRPQFATKHPWGVSYAAGTEGFTRAQMVRGISQYKPKLVAFQGDAATTTFTLPTAYSAVNTDKIAVWVDGALTTTGITKATNSITWTTAPTTDANIVVFYEHE